MTISAVGALLILFCLLAMVAFFVYFEIADRNPAAAIAAIFLVGLILIMVGGE